MLSIEQNSTTVMPASFERAGCKHSGPYYMKSEEIIGFEALYESMEKCKRGVMWKNSVAHYVLNSLEETIKLSDQLKGGTYKSRKVNKFTIYAPKRRDIISVSYRDRVYQRSLNDNGIYAGMTRSFIEDNQACQIGKGTDRAMDRLEEFLHRGFRRYGRTFYVLQVDIHGYYRHMVHQTTENMFRKNLDPEIADRAIRVMREQYKEERGYNPGSQMIQIAGISYLNPLDHFIKERLRIKLYLRYMDDFVMMHPSAEYLEECKSKIESRLAEIGLSFNPKKTRIFPVTEGVTFLGFRFVLTETGKVLRLISSQNVKRERAKLRKMVAKCKRGEITRDKVNQCFEAWKAHADRGSTYKVQQRMNEYYRSLWR